MTDPWLPGKSKGDPFLLRYQPSELRVASEFLTTWLPFLSRDLCQRCTQTLSNRIQSLSTESKAGESKNSGGITSVLTISGNNCGSHSLGGSLKDDADTSSVGSRKTVVNGWSDMPVSDATLKETTFETPSPRLSWADMAQDDDDGLDTEEEVGMSKQSGLSGELDVAPKKKTELPRDQREYLRFMYVKRKKDFVCMERVKGRLVNIVQGLELHADVFSAVEQKRIVDFIYSLQEKGLRGELKERTFTAPRKWMRGKGRQTIQFGCCYNYTTDKDGNPPGILKRAGAVDPLPHLFKVIIKRLIRWHVLPPDCVPDSCIVNIYDEEDCIPPHIDNHDFIRPFCTISFLSECDILFGTDLRTIGPGEFTGAVSIPLPVGSVLVLNGNGADVAKHCVPAVPSKRISITFRRMDETKRPIDCAPEPELEGLEPLHYNAESLDESPPQLHVNMKVMSASERDSYSSKLHHHDAESSTKSRPQRQVNRQTPRRGFRPEGKRYEDDWYSPRSRQRGS